MSDDALYELFYWPGLPGRGELIRLAFEESDTPYIDAGVRDGYEACMGITSPEFRDGEPPVSPVHRNDLIHRVQDANPPPFAVPVLRAGSLLLSQTSNILFYLGPLLHLAPEDDISRLHINQLFNVVIDCINEAHDTQYVHMHFCATPWLICSFLKAILFPWSRRMRSKKSQP